MAPEQVVAAARERQRPVVHFVAPWEASFLALEWKIPAVDSSFVLAVAVYFVGAEEGLGLHSAAGFVEPVGILQRSYWPPPPSYSPWLWIHVLELASIHV